MVLTSTHNLCSEQKYQNFLSNFFPFLVVKFSIYLNTGMCVHNEFDQNQIKTKNAMDVESKTIVKGAAILNT